MASFSFSLLLCLSFIVSSSSAARVAPSRSGTTAAAVAPRAAAYGSGPIETNGRNYTKVCDPGRFEGLGLDMADFPYCDRALPYAARVRDLVGRMSLAEKARQLGDRMQGSNRIGLQKYMWWAEALHGVADTGHATYFGDVAPAATSFANVILSAASFNETLWKRIGQATSTEGRALYNLGHTGLTFWSPNVNVARDPRWGRILETPGEDPYMVGRFGVVYVRGLQDVEGHEVAEDPDSRPLKVSSCCKHYAAYDVEENFDHHRRTFDARVHEQDMIETFLRPFEMCVREGDASSIMCSFNKINGIPICVDTRLIKQTIRDEWNFHGYIVSDCDSLDAIYNFQHWLGGTPEDAISQTTRAGLDLDCGLDKGNVASNYHDNYTLSAVAQGKMKEADIDNALTNLYTVLMRLGFFDGIPQYEGLGADDVCTEEHVELAADSARQGIVLLKNRDRTLPLSAKKKSGKRIKVALIGNNANATDVMRGNYAGPPCRYTSPLDAFSKEAEVVYRRGCSNSTCEDPELIGAAVEAARRSDVTIIVAGLDLDIEAEERDRSSLLLPGNQEKLIRKVAEASGGPVVLVLMSGGGVDVSFAEEHPKIGAIVWAGYPGQEGGQAIADVIMGRYNPGGRLPITWYRDEYVDLLPITSMQLRPYPKLGYPGRTYKFYDGRLVLYPFGHGLSYTAFRYSVNPHAATVAVNAEIGSAEHCKPVSYKADTAAPSCPSVAVADHRCEEAVAFDVDVTNAGSVDGAHAVLVYSKAPAGVEGAPRRQLVAYERVFVRAKGTERVTFEINACKALGIVERTAYVVLPAGVHAVQVGDGDGAVSFPVEVKFTAKA